MNFRLLSRLLGIVSLLIGGTMFTCLPWAFPELGYRKHLEYVSPQAFEYRGFLGLLVSVGVCLVVGALFMHFGRHAKGQLYRKEAMAVVGLSWVLATFLGALPFVFSGTYCSSSVRLFRGEAKPQVAKFGFFHWTSWYEMEDLDDPTYDALEALLFTNARGLTAQQLGPKKVADLVRLRDSNRLWRQAIVFPGEEPTPADRANHYRIRWVKMNIADCLFESQSGFSTTGATVISDLEDPFLVSHCVLFWRSVTHFLGGLGIIVLFVVILGQGSAGKALMRAEMPGPTKEGATARMQHTAWLFAGMYCGLNLVLAILLWLLDLSVFDALCHAFGTLATGGFSTYNKSLGHFNSAAIDYVVIVFMGLAGTNFTLLYFLLVWKPKILLNDMEWRTYASIILGVTFLVVVIGLSYGDFKNLAEALRFGTFQVVSIITTTGYGTHDFDGWNSFGRAVLFLLMFVGGCAGSTGGGLKVIRHILFVKILRLEIEHAYHPSVVRPFRTGGPAVEDPDLRTNILVYFGLILIIFVGSWLFVVTFESDLTWGGSMEHKLIDSATSIAATLNNIGPGLGTVGATQNYGHFGSGSKMLFVWLMMLGRLEIFSILVLFSPAFWRNR